MMMRGLFISFLLLLALNVLLLFSYFDRKHLVTSAYEAIQSGPSLNDFAYRSQRRNQFLLNTKSAKLAPFRRDIASASENLNKAVDRLSSTGEIPATEYFKDKIGLSRALQDTLWNSCLQYRAKVDALLQGIVFPERNITRVKHDILANLHLQEQTASPRQARQLQKILDTMLFRGMRMDFNLNDHERIGRLLDALDRASDPADELKLRNLLEKMDELIPARGKIVMYGQIYSLGETTSAELEVIRKELVLRKAAVEEQLSLVDR